MKRSNACQGLQEAQKQATYQGRVEIFYLVVKVCVQLTQVDHRPLVGFPQEFPALV